MHRRALWLALRLFPFIDGRQATWGDAESIARALRAVHEITSLDLPQANMDEWCVEALHDRRDHPWIGDRRDEIMAKVDRLEAVTERARTMRCLVVCLHEVLPRNVPVDGGGRVQALLDWGPQATRPRGSHR